MTRELLELITDIRDFTTLFYVILRRETSGRFIKTENIKCDVCIIIVTSRKLTTKRNYRDLMIEGATTNGKVVRQRSVNHHVQGWNIAVKHVQYVRLS